MTTPQQQSPVASEPTVSILQNPYKPPTPVAPVPTVDVDPDFPRRMHSSRTPALYDPSAPVSLARPVRHSPAPGPSHAPPAVQQPSVLPSAPQASTTPVIVTASTPSNEADIEVRLAALGLKSRQPPSYAKIVRRD